LLPDHAPDAVHESAFSVDHVSVADSPGVNVLGVALRVTCGAPALTVTVTDWDAEPPAPLQVSSYSVVFDSLPVDQVPLVASCACQPPEAVHSVALRADQVRVELPRLSTVVGDAVKVTTGAETVTTTCFDTAEAPPEPEQVSV
jgi:hypothetical protein